ncbi:glycosyltransferase family 2 protein [Intestinibacter sp.]
MKNIDDKILLFIPGYNCEKQIARVLGQLKGEVTQFIEETIVVNNRSIDNTESVVMDYIKNQDLNIKLLRNCENYGLGGSHKVAFNYAKQNGFDYVIVLHGDDQGDIGDLLSILKNKTYRNYDCCLGARFKKGSKLKGYSKFRTFGNIVYNMVFSVLLWKPIYDLGSGLNMYKVDIFKEEFYFKFPDNLSFNYCMVMATNYYKQNIMFFPISWREEDQVSNVKLANQAIFVIKMLLSYFFNKKKFMNEEHREIQHKNYNSDIILGK